MKSWPILHRWAAKVNWPPLGLLGLARQGEEGLGGCSCVTCNLPGRIVRVEGLSL